MTVDSTVLTKIIEITPDMFAMQRTFRITPADWLIIVAMVLKHANSF